eukprot:TRINITY_DN3020_c0_g3_i1.p1 TRINITY_DN3020_c0_g3~~TRINITY_DN3020_c0_g3_i1.p1  ORF type:complete len:303 (-),score=64.74 TRINITY_DN3020_c0_g3_i1:73-981(-)
MAAVDRWLELAYDCKLFPETDFRLLCQYVSSLLREEPCVLDLKSSIVIVGDIHGQFYDLRNMFEIVGCPPHKQYLFLGDYVDRGRYSMETITLLLVYKAKYPDRIHLLRGNHESRQITQLYGFYEETLKKYGSSLPWRLLMNVFDLFPIACVIDKNVFGVHGGLSPEISMVEQIRTLERVQEIPYDGPFSDLVWSDPMNIKTWERSVRGAGFYFGSEIVSKFCHLNDLQLIVRAHQVAQDGFQTWFDHEKLVTVWSAPNYMYKQGNLAAVLEIDEYQQQNYRLFDAVPDEKRKIPEKHSYLM